MGLLYKPDHPYADKNGFIDREDYVLYNFYSAGDKRMMVGNKPVQIYYNSDEMPPTQHMCSGKLFTSKKKFRNETKAYGCVEVGNDAKVSPRRRQNLDKRKRREDIKRAVWEVRNGRSSKTA